MRDRETIIYLQQKNGSIFISNNDCGKLSWEHKHVLVLDFLDHGLTTAVYGCTSDRVWISPNLGLSVLSHCILEKHLAGK